MMIRKELLFAGAIAGCIVGGGLGACSSGGSGGSGGIGGTGGSGSGLGGSNSGTLSGNPASGPSATTGGGNNPATTSVGAGGSGAGGSPACKPPGKLYPPKAGESATIYCPFSAVDGGKNQYCTPNADPTQAQHCCETAAGDPTPSGCVDGLATACTAGSVDWQCEDPVADCLDSANPVCCASGATLMLGGMMGGMACENYATGMTGTSCVAAGQCNGIIMCTNSNECPNNMTCTPFSKAGNQVGGCM
jgi:hypothetical protein